MIKGKEAQIAWALSYHGQAAAVCYIPRVPRKLRDSLNVVRDSTKNRCRKKQRI
jgi:hypothetical protein